MPELKIYTVADLLTWLDKGEQVEGLNERVIAPTRAWSIIHNPYATDEDAIVAAIFEDGDLAAYTASFPDMLEGKRVWWASTLYCYPQFAGRGYGMIVVGALMEAHEPDLTYDRWGAPETVEIFNHFGYQTTYTKRYHFGDKKIDTTTLQGKLAYCAQELKKCFHPRFKASKANYTIQYENSIDDEAYAFIKSHRKNDLWLRVQDMLNWIIQYPFFKSRESRVKSQELCVFGDEAKVYEYKVAKVYVDEQLQGVYVMRQHDDDLSVVYLYYTYENSDVVFDSIMNQIIAQRPKSFLTENQYLIERVRKSLYFPRMEMEYVSLSLPNNKQDLTTFTVQLGDGDSFA